MHKKLEEARRRAGHGTEGFSGCHNGNGIEQSQSVRY